MGRDFTTTTPGPLGTSGLAVNLGDTLPARDGLLQPDLEALAAQIHQRGSSGTSLTSEAVDRTSDRALANAAEAGGAVVFWSYLVVLEEILVEAEI